MKNASNAASGFLPNASNTTKPTTSVASVASSGASHSGDARRLRARLEEQSHRDAAACVPRRALRAPAISRPISSALVSRDRLRRRQPTLRDDGEPVADLDQLVELLGDRRARRRRWSRRSISAWRICADGADVDAPRRLRGDQHLRVLADLAADDELLQVAAGQAARRGVGPARLDAERRDRVRRVSAHGASRG